MLCFSVAGSNCMDENTSPFHWNPHSWYIHSKKPQKSLKCLLYNAPGVLNRWIPMPSGHSMAIAFVHPSFIFLLIFCLQILWKGKSLQRCFKNSWGESAAKSRTHVTQIVNMPTGQALPTHHSLSRTQVIFGRRVKAASHSSLTVFLQKTCSAFVNQRQCTVGRRHITMNCIFVDVSLTWSYTCEIAFF